MLSHYQSDIVRWAKEGRGDGIVRGVAGCGKTYTLVQVANTLRGPALSLAFNNHNAKDLAQKMPSNVTSKTIHSVGLAACIPHAPRRKTNVNGYKYKDIVTDLYRGTPQADADDYDEIYKSTMELVDLSRLRLVDLGDPYAADRMCRHFGIDYYGPEVEVARRALLVGIDQFRNIGKIDFTDMIWLPVHLNFRAASTYDFVLVDECQDLSPCQLEMVLKTRAMGGRMLFVGDPYQSIMGFAGADEQSYHKIKDRVNAQELPLSICYRCPTSHLDLAREFVPEIEARPEAPSGVIEHVPQKGLADMIQGEDLILCRTTAPLVTLCLKLIAQGVPARVRGRSIGEGMVAVIKKVQKTVPWNKFLAGLEDHFDKATERFMNKRNGEGQLARLNDQRDAIWAAYEAKEPTSYDSFLYAIDQMFSDGQALITLSTIHRAKGLEANRVFIINPDKMMLNFTGQQEWQTAQERNVKYVGLTRAKQALYFVQKD